MIDLSSKLTMAPNRRAFVNSTSLGFLLGLLFVGNYLQADEPKALDKAGIQALVLDGDRLADQGDYLNALRKYTEAYMGVVSRIRGQAFKEVVEPKMFSREDLGKEMLEQLDKEYSEEELELMDSSYKVLGLMKPSQDSKKLVTKMLTEEVAGFYDPDNKRMVLIVDETGTTKDPSWLGRLLGARPTFDKDEQKTTLAHELTHALQDQLYDLNKLQTAIESDDDMLLAFSALVEGDATLLMFVEADEGVDVTEMDPVAMRATFNLMSWMIPMAGGNTFRQAPPIFRESLVFPYMQGMLFVLTVASKDGWPAVHAAYQHPPLSTEQIMHPSKYLEPEKLDVPQQVEFPQATEFLPEGWKHLGGNCLGELQTSIMLQRVRGGTLAAAGWDGDRYEIFRNEEGKLAAAYVSIWDSPEDAEEFEQVYWKYRETNPFGAEDVFQSSAKRVVQRDGDKVIVVEGFAEEVASEVAQALQACKFVEKKFPMPGSMDSAEVKSEEEAASTETSLDSELPSDK